MERSNACEPASFFTARVSGLTAWTSGLQKTCCWVCADRMMTLTACIRAAAMNNKTARLNVALLFWWGAILTEEESETTPWPGLTEKRWLTLTSGFIREPLSYDKLTVWLVFKCHVCLIHMSLRCVGHLNRVLYVWKISAAFLCSVMEAGRRRR